MTAHLSDLSALLPLALAVAFGGVGLPLLAARAGRHMAAFACALVMVSALLLLIPLFPAALTGNAVIASHDWLPQYGLNLAFRFDGLGALFAALILGIGLLVVLYAYYYLPAADRLGRFYALLLLFMASMLGIVLSENMLLLVVFWELTSISSFLLIAYKSGETEARIAARMALAVTGGGGLALLAGVLLLGHVVGSFELTDMLAAGEQVHASALYLPILALVLLGAFTKSAQFPFHFWLPNAMAAPTPVSAYLHSATMVKAGVFLLARLYPVLSGSEAWFIAVSSAGAVTLIYGAYLALQRHDFKGLLAYSTISNLGLIMLLFGLGTPMSVVAGIFHIINHAIFKASLFMAAGIIDHECGTRDMRRLNGLFKYMPITATLAIIAAGSMAGIPLLNGFISKEMFFAEAVTFSGFGLPPWLLPTAATLGGMLAVAYSARFVHEVFFNGDPVDLPREPHEPVHWMRAPMEILVVLCLLLGVMPAWSAGAWLAAAAGAALQAPLPAYDLKVWHGFNPAFIMSLIALFGGIALYRWRSLLYRLHDRLPSIHERTAFERSHEIVRALAERLLAFLDNGSLQRYVLLLCVFTLVYGTWASTSSGIPMQTAALLPADTTAILGAAALAVGAGGAAIMHRRRLLAVVLVNIAGLMVTLIFVRFSAPDLALTQLAVEIVTTLLMLLALFYLPQVTQRQSSHARLVRDGAVALAAGAGMAVVAYTLLASPFDTISAYYLAHAVPGGGGSNVVNVILVDFRGFDTLGEITVLAMAALGAHALLDRLHLPSARGFASRLSIADRHPLFLRMLMQPLLPLALAVAIYIFLRGHNLPGGGFIAGLVTGVALIAQSLAYGSDHAQTRLPRRYPALLALGLACAVGIGMASGLFGRPFLTSTHGHMALPLLGDMELASATVFDLGVYIVVVATVLLILSELGRIAPREAQA
jgi:multicomponent K+:H+ antiporter subunit A